MSGALLLEGRSIIVTGGGNGIGRAVALRCAEAGAAVTVTDMNVAAGEAVAETILGFGGQARFTRLDVTDETETESAVASAVAAFGRLDGACNAAGMPWLGVALDEIPVEAWDRIHAVNLRGLFLSMKYQAKAMLAGAGGSIVNIASTAGIAGVRHGADYCSSKGGVVAVTRGAAVDYGRRGIRVNAVLPGATETKMLRDAIHDSDAAAAAIAKMSPIGRLGQPDEIAFAVRWLLSDEASFVTGVALPVDGGWTAV